MNIAIEIIIKIAQLFPKVLKALLNFSDFKPLHTINFIKTLNPYILHSFALIRTDISFYNSACKL